MINIMQLAEARLAVEYLARAEVWAAELDRELAQDVGRLHRRLERRIEEAASSTTRP
jgi:hypothetical protein